MTYTMTRMKKILYITLLLCLPFWQHSSHAQSLTNAALTGIESMGVVVNPIDPDLVRTDFSVDYFKTQLEVELRKAGIKVTDHTTLAETTGRPYLELTIHAVKVALNMYSYHIELKLMQHVQLRREPNMILSTITWTRTQLGNQNRSKFHELNKDIQFMTNQFINDYFTVNPK